MHFNSSTISKNDFIWLLLEKNNINILVIVSIKWPWFIIIVSFEVKSTFSQIITYSKTKIKKDFSSWSRCQLSMSKFLISLYLELKGVFLYMTLKR